MEENKQVNASLYSISQDLLNIFEDIYNNDGEITEETEGLLNIKENELKVKLQQYVYAIKSWEDDIDSCKKELDRIKKFKESKEKRIKLLKDRLLDAVTNFGLENKNGVKYIETDLFKLSINRSTSSFVNENRLNLFINILYTIIKNSLKEGLFSIDEGFNMTETLKVINSTYKKLYDESSTLGVNNIFNSEPYLEFTEEDLISIEFTFKINTTLNKLFANKKLLQSLSETDLNIDMTPNNSKIYAKECISNAKGQLTWCNLEYNKNLKIK